MNVALCLTAAATVSFALARIFFGFSVSVCAKPHISHRIYVDVAVVVICYG